MKFSIDRVSTNYFFIAIPLILLCFCSFGDAVSGHRSEIPWTKETQLKWDDFKGHPDGSASYLAATKTTISVEPVQLTRDSLTYEVTSYFNPELSWCKDTTLPDLLRHEQLHFDIAEWVSRLLRKEFGKMQLQEIEPDYKAISETFDHYEAMLDSLNTLYDRETKHGSKMEPQLRWNGKVSSALEQLSAYAERKVVIMRRKNKS